MVSVTQILSYGAPLQAICNYDDFINQLIKGPKGPGTAERAFDAPHSGRISRCIKPYFLKCEVTICS
jgi:hypothetical protein